MINPISDNMAYISQMAADTDDFNNGRWHTLLRKMSVIATPEQSITGTTETLEKSIVEEVNLPTVEECLDQEDYETAISYFETDSNTLTDHRSSSSTYPSDNGKNNSCYYH